MYFFESSKKYQKNEPQTGRTKNFVFLYFGFLGMFSMMCYAVGTI